ncbi:hypothetical protein ACFPN7_04030 [Amycolatopsis halotolerans]|uniref:hypothetical protein n=1 Tax=Amycolatopsis halotolerans TaxID=330083 RepID=UPI00361F097E
MAARFPPIFSEGDFRRLHSSGAARPRACVVAQFPRRFSGGEIPAACATTERQDRGSPLGWPGPQQGSRAAHPWAEVADPNAQLAVSRATRQRSAEAMMA